MHLPRRAALTAAALVAALLAAPASAVVLGPDEGVAQVLGATEVAPRPVALTTAVGAGEPVPGGAAAAAALGRRVSDALSASGAGTVAAAVDVDGLGPVLRREATRALPPASTQKSFTSLSALVAIGPNARYRTEVVATRVPVAGRLRGELWLVAGGDPYLSKHWLRLLARSVRAAGITRVDGDVRLDDLRYDQRRTPAGWKAGFLPAESGPLSAFAVDRNAYRTDAAFLADPAFPNAVLFRDYLRAEGVQVFGTVRRAPRPVGGRVVAAHNGRTLGTVVRQVLKDSDNFGAEMVLKELGRSVRADGSSAGGITATRQVLGPLGVGVGAGTDGSGLSSLDRQTPVGQLQLLAAAQASPSGPSFRSALPIGCRDGTLLRRFCGTPAAGRVHAKTGTLRGVRALAGYTTTASGRPVRFAVPAQRRHRRGEGAAAPSTGLSSCWRPRRSSRPAPPILLATAPEQPTGASGLLATAPEQQTGATARPALASVGVSDTGGADPRLATALAALTAAPSAAAHAEALAALAGARVFAAITAASTAEHTDPGTGLRAESTAEMALLTLVGSPRRPCGPAVPRRRGAVGFREGARPVPLAGRRPAPRRSTTGRSPSCSTRPARRSPSAGDELGELAAGRVPVAGTPLSARRTTQR